jgi:hypothetical protein
MNVYQCFGVDWELSITLFKSKMVIPCHSHIIPSVRECQCHEQRRSFENLFRIKSDDLISVIYGDSH